MVKLGLKVLAGLVATSSAQDVGYETLFETAPEEFAQRCVKLSGTTVASQRWTFPDYAEGDFIIPSVGRFELGENAMLRHFVGFGDGFGKLQKFALKGNEVCATYRMMETKFYNDSLKDATIAPSFLFYETEPPRHCPMGMKIGCKYENLKGGNDNTFVNTVKVGEHLLSLTDSPFGVEVDPDTLGVIGKFMWEDNLTDTHDEMMGIIPYSGSAHPLRHPATGKVVDFVGTENMMSGQANMKIFEIDDAKPKTRNPLVDVPDGTPPYMHSFGLTDKHVVLPHMPVKFDFGAVVMKASMTAAFEELHPVGVSPDNAFHIMPLNADNDTKPIVQMLPVDDRLYYTHTVNTYENTSGIVIDLVVTSGNPFAGNLTIAHSVDKKSRDTDSARLAVRRFLLPLDNDTAITSEYLSDPTMSTDFTKMNLNYMGKEHCFFWAVEWFSDHTVFASMSVVKHSICGDRKTLRWHKPNWYPSEATLIPSSNSNAAEDDGLLVFTALDGANKQSHFVVVDPKTMQEVSSAGPFPAIGFTTHGEFYKAGAPEMARAAAESVIV